MSGSFRTNAHIVARTFAGILLIAAAEFKAYQLTVGYAEVSLLMESRLIATCAVILEFLLGPCLLLGLYPSMTWRSAVLVFLGFSAISTYLWLRGAPTCGCLGGLSVLPKQMLVVDLIVFTALLLFPPPRLEARSNLAL